MRKRLAYLVLLGWPLWVVAQRSGDSTVVKSVAVKNIDKITHDQFYNIYISTLNGQIHKYDKNGTFLLSNSPTKPQAIDQIEGSNTIRIFCFYKDLQEFNYFDRFLTFENPIKLDPQLIGYAKTATTSSDNSIWIFDEADYSLKKYDPIQQKILQNTNCGFIFEKGEHSITYMREYQNKLYLLEKDSCIYIFDNLGNFNKQIKMPNVKQISFFNDELLLLLDKKVRSINLYDHFAIQDIELDARYGHFFKSSEYLYVFTDNTFKILKHYPPK